MHAFSRSDPTANVNLLQSRRCRKAIADDASTHIISKGRFAVDREFVDIMSPPFGFFCGALGLPWDALGLLWDPKVLGVPGRLHGQVWPKYGAWARNLDWRNLRAWHG